MVFVTPKPWQTAKSIDQGDKKAAMQLHGTSHLYCMQVGEKQSNFLSLKSFLASHVWWNSHQQAGFHTQGS